MREGRRPSGTGVLINEGKTPVLSFFAVAQTVHKRTKQEGSGSWQIGG